MTDSRIPTLDSRGTAWDGDRNWLRGPTPTPDPEPTGLAATAGLTITAGSAAMPGPAPTGLAATPGPPTPGPPKPGPPPTPGPPRPGPPPKPGPPPRPGPPPAAPSPGAATRVVKRLLDITLAALLFVLTLPLLLLGMALVWIELGRPIFFTQERTGYRMRRFRMYKLRTMRPELTPDGRRLGHGERCGPLSQLLRRSSIDELPQLINILGGELSLVGPRPLLPRYDPWYTARERARFTVRPGITGLSQVAGRNQVPWDRRLALDVRYVAEWSLLLDLKILLRTAGVVVLGTGVAADPTAIMLDLDEERALVCAR